MSTSGALLLRARSRPIFNVVIPPRPPEPDAPVPVGDPDPDDITTQSETTAWLATLSEAPSADLTFATNVLFKRGKDHGWLAYLKEWFWCTPNPTVDKIRGMKGVVTGAVATNIRTVTDYSGLSGAADFETTDPDEIPAGSGWVDLNKKFSDFDVAVDDLCMFMMVSTPYGGLFNEFGSFTQNNAIGMRATSGFRGSIFLGYPGAKLYGGAGAAGFHLVCLTSNTQGYVVRDAVVTSLTHNTATFPNADIALLRSAVNTPASTSPNKLTAMGIGRSMPSATAVAMQDDFREALDLLGILYMFDQPAAAPPGPNAFTKDDIALVVPSDLEVLRFFGPPKSDLITNVTAAGGPGFANFPGSRFATSTDGIWLHDTASDSAFRSTWTTPATRNGGVDWRQWVNRGLRAIAGGSSTTIFGPNEFGGAGIPDTNGTQCKFMFDTHDLSDGASFAQASYMFGGAARNEPLDRYGRGYLDWAEVYGLDPSLVAARAYYAANRDAIFTQSFAGFLVTYNRVCLDDRRFIDVTNFANFADKGAWLDFEPADYSNVTLGSSPIATSTTSLAIGTGSKSLTVTSSLVPVVPVQVRIGQYITLFKTDDITKYMIGRVTAWNSGTGALTFTSLGTGGSGTINNWSLTTAGPARCVNRLATIAGILKDLGGYNFAYSPHIPTEGTGIAAGFSTASAPLLMQNADIDTYTVIGSKNIANDATILASLNSQINLAKGPAGDQPIDWSKVRLTTHHNVGTLQMAVADATIIRNFMLTNSIKKFTPLPGGAPWGGAKSNRINQCLATLLGLSLT